MASKRLQAFLLLTCTVFFWSALYAYVPILSPYARLIGASLSQVGLVIASYGLTQFLFRFPIGVWSGYIGRQKPFVMSGFILALFSSLGMALSPNTWLLLFFRALSGVSASMWVAFTVLYSNYYPDEQSTKAMSLITFSSGLAQMLSTYIGGKVADIYGWTMPFYIGSVLALLGATLVLPIDEKRAQTRFAISHEKLKTILLHKRLWAVSMMTSLSHFSTFVTTYAFLPIYAMDIGATKSDLGLIMFLTHLCQTISTYLAGTLVAPKVGYKATVSMSFISASLLILYIPYIKNLIVLHGIVSLSSFARGLAYPILMGLSIQGMGKEDKATAMGFYQAIYALGMFAGPATGGYLGEAFGLKGVFILSSIVFMAAGSASLYLLPNKTNFKQFTTK